MAEVVVERRSRGVITNPFASRLVRSTTSTPAPAASRPRERRPTITATTISTIRPPPTLRGAAAGCSPVVAASEMIGAAGSSGPASRRNGG